MNLGAVHKEEKGFNTGQISGHYSHLAHVAGMVGF